MAIMSARETSEQKVNQAMDTLMSIPHSYSYTESGLTQQEQLLIDEAYEALEKVSNMIRHGTP